MLKIKELRESRKIKQKEMAEILQVPNNTYNQWENEKRQPDHDMLVRIAKYFGVTVDYLLGREEETQKEKSPSNDGLLPDEQALLSIYRMTPSEKRLDFIRQLINLVPDEDQTELAAFVLEAIKTSK